LSRRQEIIERITYGIRRSQVRTDAYDDAVASALRLNRTDYRCVDLLDLEGPMTAGRLARAVGVSTAAITTAIDRLERAGVARRRRDDADRRRVLVELVPGALAESYGYFEPLVRRGNALYEGFSDEELEVVARFLDRGNEVFEDVVDEVHALVARQRGTRGEK
jgi:DNA-binding MarR family transcriptional regulator